MRTTLQVFKCHLRLIRWASKLPCLFAKRGVLQIPRTRKAVLAVHRCHHNRDFHIRSNNSVVRAEVHGRHAAPASWHRSLPRGCDRIVRGIATPWNIRAYMPHNDSDGNVRDGPSPRRGIIGRMWPNRYWNGMGRLRGRRRTYVPLGGGVSKNRWVTLSEINRKGRVESSRPYRRRAWLFSRFSGKTKRRPHLLRG